MKNLMSLLLILNSVAFAGEGGTITTTIGLSLPLGPPVSGNPMSGIIAGLYNRGPDPVDANFKNVNNTIAQQSANTAQINASTNQADD